METKNKNLIPKTGFNVIKIWEDMDCITPTDDEHFIVAIKDTLKGALKTANELYSVFGLTYVIDSNGKKFDRNYQEPNYNTKFPDTNNDIINAIIN